MHFQQKYLQPLKFYSHFLFSSQGLGVLQVSRPVALTLCALYGIWLVIAVFVYILLSPKKGSYNLEKTEEVRYGEGSFQTKMTELGSRKDSSLSSRSQNTGKGLQPLSKNVISDEKMVQLRKKSIDPAEALRQRAQLDSELGLQHHDSFKSDTDDKVCNAKLNRLEKLQECEELESPDEPDNSRTALIVPEHLQQSSSEPYIPPSSPPQGSTLKPKFRITTSSDSSEDEQKDTIDNQRISSPVASISSLSRAHTFTCPMTSAMDDDSDNNSLSGSLRLTRHSKRARKSMDGLFSKSASAEPLSVRADNVTSPVQEQPKKMRARYRKPALVPPIITTTPAVPSPLAQISSYTNHTQTEGHLGHNISSIQRGVSPTPSTEDSVFDDSSPKPRKKKVSVAQIEATIFPPTPLTLEPPVRLGISRSASFSTNQNTFADNAFRSVMKMSHDAIVCANSVGEIVYWSSGAVKMFGYTPGEAIGSSLEVSK